MDLRGKRQIKSLETYQRNVYALESAVDILKDERQKIIYDCLLDEMTYRQIALHLTILRIMYKTILAVALLYFFPSKTIYCQSGCGWLLLPACRKMVVGGMIMADNATGRNAYDVAIDLVKIHVEDLGINDSDELKMLFVEYYALATICYSKDSKNLYEFLPEEVRDKISES